MGERQEEPPPNESSKSLPSITVTNPDQKSPQETRNEKEKKASWHNEPKIRPNYGKRKSLLPKSHIGQVLFSANPTEGRIGDVTQGNISNAKQWTKNLLELEKKAFIIRQLLQQESMRQQGIKTASLLPKVVIEAHKRLARLKFLNMSYTGGKDLPLSHRLNKAAIARRFSKDFFLENESSAAESRESLVQRLADFDISTQHSKDYIESDSDDSDAYDTQPSFAGSKQIRKVNSFVGLSKKSPAQQKEHTWHGNTSTTNAERTSEKKSKIAKHHKDRKTSHGAHQTKLPTISPPKRSVTFVHSDNKPAASKGHRKKRGMTREKTLPVILNFQQASPRSVQDQRFMDLAESLSPYTSPRDGFTMLSESNWPTTSISLEDTQIIKERYMPAHGKYSQVRFAKMEALANGTFNLDEDEELVS